MEDAALEMWELCTTTLLLGCTPAKNELVVIMISCPVNRNDFLKSNEYIARHISISALSHYKIKWFYLDICFLVSLID